MLIFSFDDIEQPEQGRVLDQFCIHPHSLNCYICHIATQQTFQWLSCHHQLQLENYFTWLILMLLLGTSKSYIITTTSYLLKSKRKEIKKNNTDNYQKMLHTQIVLENMNNQIREVIRVVSFKANKYDLKCPGKSQIDKLI